jgi:GNAT superfamily N-acetyltransferase
LVYCARSTALDRRSRKRREPSDAQGLIQIRIIHPMSLPILQVRQPPSRDDLVRFYYRTELHWSRQLATEEAVLDVGVALFNPDLPEARDAHMMFDASLPDGVSADRAVAEADEFFRARGGRCRMWVINPSATPAAAQPLEGFLLAHGCTKGGHDIYHLASGPVGSVQEIGGITLIPARASFRHARELMAEWGPPYIVDAMMMHLEDPQTDALLALKDGVAVALVTVLAVGDMGCIENLYVAEKHRGQGLGRTMMSRAMEICARSIFKHVFIGVNAANTVATTLYTKLGFEKVGEFVSYVADA